MTCPGSVLCSSVPCPYFTLRSLGMRMFHRGDTCQYKTLLGRGTSRVRFCVALARAYTLQRLLKRLDVLKLTSRSQRQQRNSSGNPGAYRQRVQADADYDVIDQPVEFRVHKLLSFVNALARPPRNVPVQLLER